MHRLAFAAAILILFASGVLLQLKGPVEKERTYRLPCHPDLFAPSGDGEIVWIACQETPNESRFVRSYRPTTVYALDVNSGHLTELAHSPGIDMLLPAPTGDQVAIVWPDESQHDEVVLYQRTRRAGKLPIDSWPVAWSAEAKRLFFVGGSTVEGDAWNILGILTIQGLTVSRQTLSEPTENVYVCAATGHAFLGNEIDAAGTVDYDPEFVSPQRGRFPPGRCSATGRYVATTPYTHGPMPWGIFDTATGRELMHFDFTGDGLKDEFAFHSWNPRQDGLLLRILYSAPIGISERAILQVFDLGRQRVLGSLPVSSDEVVWSRDGRRLILARGNALVFHPIGPLN
jgi:hypothetical protein